MYLIVSLCKTGYYAQFMMILRLRITSIPSENCQHKTSYLSRDLKLLHLQNMYLSCSSLETSFFAGILRLFIS